ncbi:hypothetical protein BJ742DRAFT_766709 [Cladochytrium replicatum]|nr:hypothetical protein BJ742DRAFT_766709 [Cladochytrium replicatum]
MAGGGTINNLCRTMLDYHRRNMEFIDFLRNRENVMQSCFEDFQALEEQNIILKDILFQIQSGKGASGKIEVELRYVATFDQNKPPVADKFTNTNDSGIEVVTSGDSGEKDIDIQHQTAVAPGCKDQKTVPITADAVETLEAVSIGSTPSTESSQTSLQQMRQTSTLEESFSERESMQELHQSLNSISSKKVKFVLETFDRAVGNDVPPPTFAEVEAFCELPTLKELTLQDENKELLNQIEMIRATLKGLEEVDEINKAALAEEKAQNSFLKGELFQLENVTLAEMNAEATRWENAAAEAKRIETVVRADVERLTSELSKRISELESARRSAREFGQQAETMERANKELTEKYGGLETNLSMLQKKFEHVSSLLQTSQSASSELQSSLSQSQDSEEKARDRCGEYHHTIVRLSEENENLQIVHREMQSAQTVLNYKILELENLLATIMRYPDASIGQEPAIEKSSEDLDHILKEFIHANNARIALLEQKNNDYRMQRLRIINQQPSGNEPNKLRFCQKGQGYPHDYVSNTPDGTQAKPNASRALKPGSSVNRAGTGQSCFNEHEQNHQLVHTSFERSEISTFPPHNLTKQPGSGLRDIPGTSDQTMPSRPQSAPADIHSRQNYRAEAINPPMAAPSASSIGLWETAGTERVMNLMHHGPSSTKQVELTSKSTSARVLKESGGSSNQSKSRPSSPSIKWKTSVMREPPNTGSRFPPEELATYTVSNDEEVVVRTLRWERVPTKGKSTNIKHAW